MFSFCKVEEETIIHLFANCQVIRYLWSELQLHYNRNLSLPNLTPQSAFLGFIEINENIIIVNHILLIFKMTIYRSRRKQRCILQLILNMIDRIYNTEKQITFLDPRKSENNINKWASIKTP